MRNRILAGLLAMTLSMTLAAQKRTVTDAEVKRVHASALLIDTHDDFPTEQGGNDRPAGTALDIGVASPKAHTDLARLREGGVGAVLPVDLHIKGCPPRPSDLLKGLLVLMERPSKPK